MSLLSRKVEGLRADLEQWRPDRKEATVREGVGTINSREIVPCGHFSLGREALRAAAPAG